MTDVNSKQVNDYTKEMHKYIWFQIIKIYGCEVKSEMRMLKNQNGQLQFEIPKPEYKVEQNIMSHHRKFNKISV